MRTQTKPHSTFAGASALAFTTAFMLALTGCGSSGSSSSGGTQASTQASTETSTAATEASTASTASEKVPRLNIELGSSVKPKQVPARYTCDSANVPIPLNWSKVPAHTAELELFVMSNTSTGGLFVSWAVAGLKPSLHKISSNFIPSGAIVGRNGYGADRYSICPPSGTVGQYVVALLALPHRIAVKPGFDGAALRERTVHIATSEGLWGFSYKRT